MKSLGMLFKYKIFYIIFTLALFGLLLIPNKAHGEDWEMLVYDTQITSAHTASWYPRILADSLDNLHITWFDYREGNYEIYYTKLDNNGNKLLNDTRLTFNRAGSYWPVLAIDSRDNIHIAWHDNREGNYEIYYLELDNEGNILIQDARLTIRAGISAAPAIAVDDDDNLHICWYDNRDGNYEIYYKKIDNSGNTLVEDIRLTDEAHHSLCPNLTVDDFGNVHVVWYDVRDRNWEIYYTKLDNNGNTLVDDIRLTHIKGASAQPVIAVDSANDVHIAWYDNRNGSYGIYYTKLDNDGNTLVDDTLLTDKNNSRYYSPNMLIDTEDNVHICWYDNHYGNFEIYYTKLDNNGNTLVNDTRLTYNKGVSYAPSMTIDSQNQVHISWQDDRTGRREIYYIKGNMVNIANGVYSDK